MTNFCCKKKNELMFFQDNKKHYSCLLSETRFLETAFSCFLKSKAVL